MLNYLKTRLLITTICLTAILGSTLKVDCQSKKKIKDYCPASGEVQGWYAQYEPRIVKGDDLFLQINGGADIYLEYGFRDAVFHSYKLESGSAINLEIYRMKSSESTYGIYTFKTGNSGKPIGVGHDGWMEEYYLNFWQGDILVTLIGLDTKKETLEGLVQFAKSIDSKIVSSSIQPDILNYLPEKGLTPNGKTYLKGNLALFNQYVFDSRNVFGITEGVHGEYGAYSLFLLFYKDNKESQNWFKSAKEALKENGLFHDFYEEGFSLSMKDQDGHSICIVVGAGDTDFSSIFNLTKARFIKQEPL